MPFNAAGPTLRFAKAKWQRGLHATVCNAVYVGSNPTFASIPLQLIRRTSASERVGKNSTRVIRTASAARNTNTPL